jgi:hypothetical protein
MYEGPLAIMLIDAMLVLMLGDCNALLFDRKSCRTGSSAQKRFRATLLLHSRVAVGSILTGSILLFLGVLFGLFLCSTYLPASVWVSGLSTCARPFCSTRHPTVVFAIVSGGRRIYNRYEHAAPGRQVAIYWGLILWRISSFFFFFSCFLFLLRVIIYSKYVSAI